MSKAGVRAGEVLCQSWIMWYNVVQVSPVPQGVPELQHEHKLGCLLSHPGQKGGSKGGMGLTHVFTHSDAVTRVRG